jgi:hypothetical protein
MLNNEKNKKVLDLLGIETVKALDEISEGDPVYPKAVIHVWQLITIDEGLKRKDAYDDIARNAVVCIKTVLRRRNRLFRFKPKKRSHKN